MLAPYRVLDLTDGRAELGHVRPRRPRGRRRQGRAAWRRLVAPRAPDRRRRAGGTGQPAVPRLQPRQAQRRPRPRRPRRPARPARPRRHRRLRVRERRARRDGRPRPRLRGAARGAAGPRLRRPVPLRPDRALRPPPRHRPDARRDGRRDGAQRRPRSAPGAHHGAPDLAPRGRRERARRARRPRAPAGDRGGPVRRRLRAGGGLLDRPAGHDRPRHRRQGHRAQRHRAPAEHARHAPRVPLRRRRGLPDRDRRHRPRPAAVDGRERGDHRRLGRRRGLDDVRPADAHGRAARALARGAARRRHRVHDPPLEDGALRGRHRPRRDARPGEHGGGRARARAARRARLLGRRDAAERARAARRRRVRQGRRAPVAWSRPAPDIGEHTREVLDALGPRVRRARPGAVPAGAGAAPARGRAGGRLLLDRRRPDHGQGARRPRRHGRARRARQARRPPAPRRPVQGRHRRRQPLPVLRLVQHVEAVPAARPQAPRRQRHRPPAARVVRHLPRLVHRRDDGRPRPRLRRRPGAEPRHHHGHDVPPRAVRPGSQARRLRLPRGGGQRLLRDHGLGRPPAGRTVQRLHRHHRAALPDHRPAGRARPPPADRRGAVHRPGADGVGAALPRARAARRPGVRSARPAAPATTIRTTRPHDAYPCAGDGPVVRDRRRDRRPVAGAAPGAGRPGVGDGPGARHGRGSPRPHRATSTASWPRSRPATRRAS